jgi:hypothetical protein
LTGLKIVFAVTYRGGPGNLTGMVSDNDVVRTFDLGQRVVLNSGLTGTIHSFRPSKDTVPDGYADPKETVIVVKTDDGKEHWVSSEQILG